jgi:hypothetical protein
LRAFCTYCSQHTGTGEEKLSLLEGVVVVNASQAKHISGYNYYSFTLESTSPLTKLVMSNIPNKRRHSDTEQEDEHVQKAALKQLGQLRKEGLLDSEYWYGNVIKLNLWNLPIVPALIGKLPQL